MFEQIFSDNFVLYHEQDRVTSKWESTKIEIRTVFIKQDTRCYLTL
jgi:hypothetical protein